MFDRLKTAMHYTLFKVTGKEAFELKRLKFKNSDLLNRPLKVKFGFNVGASQATKGFKASAKEMGF